MADTAFATYMREHKLPLPMGFCIEKSSLVTYEWGKGYTCECAPTPHEFARNDDGTFSPVERETDDPWFTAAELRRAAYRYPDLEAL